MTLTAADLAVPQLGSLVFADSATGAIVDTVYVPVGYNVKPTGVAFDQSRNRLYIATPPQPGDPQFPGNSVVTLDLTSGSIGPILQAGGVVGDLGLSDDGSALYVVIEGLNVVRKLGPATFTSLGDFNFRPVGYKGPYPNAPVTDMIAVMPGRPGTVVLGFSPDVGYSNTQVAIFDAGVQRPNTLESGSGGFSSMLFSPDGKYLFQNGAMSYADSPNSANNQPAILRYTLDSTGIPNQTPPLAAGSGAAAILGGTLYTSLGTTVDYQAMRATGNFGVGGAVAVDALTQRAFVLYTPSPFSSSGASDPIELIAFAIPSLEPLGSQIVGVAANPALKDSEKCIRFGTDGFIVPSINGLFLFHTPIAGPAPVTAANAVVQAAAQRSGPIAPGEIISIYGANLGPATPQSAVSANGVFPSVLSNVQVWFGRLSGTPLVAYQGQLNVVAPFELQPGTNVDLQVLYFGIPSPKISVPVSLAAPALFTRDGSGRGSVSVINQDGSINKPSPPGSIVTLYGTGGGISANAVDGIEARRADSLMAPVRISIAGRDAQVLYAGAAPGLVNGVFQLNVQVPSDTPAGAASVTVNVGGQDSPQGASLEIR